jgi:hypothetical protein
MAMSAKSRKEMNKARELLWWFLTVRKPTNRCYFCKGILLTEEQQDMMRDGFVRFGNATAPPLDLGITLHHKDENHDNNNPNNLAPSHDGCHKRHHAVKVFRKWRAA